MPSLSDYTCRQSRKPRQPGDVLMSCLQPVGVTQGLHIDALACPGVKLIPIGVGYVQRQRRLFVVR